MSNRIVPGLVLGGRYRLEDLLDDVDGARFWRGTDTVLARSVALHALEEDDPRALMLLDAARDSVSVPDPHLLRVLDCDRQDGLAWVVNEWGDGTSLDRLGAPLPAQRAAVLVHEVAEAIAHAHATGRCHGRLVPENVIVLRSGEVKLIGFAVDAAFQGEHLRSGNYPDDAPRAADVHDLAGLLYYTLTARWPGASASDCPSAPRDAQGPLRPRQVRAGIPRSLDQLCGRALGPTHHRAVRTARDLADALDTYLGETGTGEIPIVAAPPVPPSYDERNLEPTQTIAAPVAAAPAEDAGGPPTQLGASVPPAVGVVEDAAETQAVPVTSYDDDPVPSRPLFAPGPPRAQPTAPEPAPTQAHAGPGAGSTQDPVVDSGQLDGSKWFTGDIDEVGEGYSPQRRSWLRVPLIAGLLVVAVVVVVLVSVLTRQPNAAPPRRPGDGGSSATSSPPAPGQPLKITAAQDFDPDGNGSEHPEQVRLAYDGNPATGWQTVTYYGSPELGGEKPGVGLLLDLGKAQHVGSVAVDLTGVPTGMSLYAADPNAPKPTNVDTMTSVAQVTANGSQVVLQPTKPVTTRYLVLWLTSLPPYQGGYRGQIDEVHVRS